MKRSRGKGKVSVITGQRKSIKKERILEVEGRYVCKEVGAQK